MARVGCEASKNSMNSSAPSHGEEPAELREAQNSRPHTTTKRKAGVYPSRIAPAGLRTVGPTCRAHSTHARSREDRLSPPWCTRMVFDRRRTLFRSRAVEFVTACEALCSAGERASREPVSAEEVISSLACSPRCRRCPASTSVSTAIRPSGVAVPAACCFAASRRRPSTRSWSSTIKSRPAIYAARPALQSAGHRRAVLLALFETTTFPWMREARNHPGQRC